jgi:hypothetical protein
MQVGLSAPGIIAVVRAQNVGTPLAEVQLANTVPGDCWAREITHVPMDVIVQPLALKIALGIWMVTEETVPPTAMRRYE